MRTKPVLSDSLNNRILCETSWTHDGEVRLQPRTTYSDRMSHCCNASRRPAHEYSSLGPGAKGHFHLNKAKGLGDLRICEASLLDHRHRFSAATEERENAPVADPDHQKDHSSARKEVTLDKSSDLQKEMKRA